jgi:threonine/homoserine efflux transporter RhtA
MALEDMAPETASGYPFLGLIWTMLILFGLAAWFWLIYIVLTDLFGRRDLSGWAKAAWTAAVILLPFLGVLAYLVVLGGDRGQRRPGEAR